LAQFNFSRSRDLIGDTPTDLLLLFGDPLNGYNDLRFEWIDTVEQCELVSEYDFVGQTAGVPALWGSIWRTSNFPSWATRAGESDSLIDLDDGTRVLDAFLIPQFLGMQIGPCPFLPAWDPIAANGERILCSLSTVVPRVGAPFAMLNRPKPLSEEESESYKLRMSRITDVDGSGVLYVVIGEGMQTRVELVDL
jgi:hypothetical protein